MGKKENNKKVNLNVYAEHKKQFDETKEKRTVLAICFGIFVFITIACITVTYICLDFVHNSYNSINVNQNVKDTLKVKKEEKENIQNVIKGKEEEIKKLDKKIKDLNNIDKVISENEETKEKTYNLLQDNENYVKEYNKKINKTTKQIEMLNKKINK